MPDIETYDLPERLKPEFIAAAWKVGNLLDGSGKIITSDKFIVAPFLNRHDKGLVATFSIFRRPELGAKNENSMESWQVQTSNEAIYYIKHRLPNEPWEVLGPEEDLPLEQQEIITLIADQLP